MITIIQNSLVVYMCGDKLQLEIYTKPYSTLSIKEQLIFNMQCFMIIFYLSKPVFQNE